MPDGYQNMKPRPAFIFRPDKAAEAIEIIARAQPGITQYFVGKILYLADKAHFLDYGRPITFDRYVAMKHGPVPSEVRNMLAAAAGADNGMSADRKRTAIDHATELLKRVQVKFEVGKNGERQSVFPTESPVNANLSCLSGSDIECLETAIAQHGGMSFGTLREETHKDEAWREAWNDRADGRVADIDISLWAEPEERESFRKQLLEYGAYS